MSEKVDAHGHYESSLLPSLRHRILKFCSNNLLIRSILIEILKYSFLLAAAFIINMPFYYMCITAIKGAGEIGKIAPTFWVENPNFEPLLKLINGTSFLKATLNSILVSLCSTLGNLLFCPLAGYAFAKLNFPGKKFLFLFLMSSMMVPSAILLVPGFLFARDLGWINSFLPLILPNIGTAFFVFLSRQYICKVPNILINAARLDGCSDFMIFVRIILPLCRPLLASIGILSFLNSWNSFIGPMVYLFDENKYTLPLVLSLLQGRFKAQESVQMAGSMLAVLPVLIIFFFFQRQIIESFAASGLKE